MIIGVFFLLFGLSILFRVFFGWHIPVFRTFFAVFLIYFGIRMLVGGNWGWEDGWRIKDSQKAIFERGDFQFETGAPNHYTTA